MNIIAHGIDLVETARLGQSIDRFGERFLDRVFTPQEQAYCNKRSKTALLSYAGRFAIKEAVMKVLGTGWVGGIAWTDIEVHSSKSGKPTVELHNICKEIADKLGIREIHISISHVQSHAMGSAIAVGCAPQTKGNDE